MYLKFQAFLEKAIGPIATKMSESKIVQALTNGMMSVLPVTLGVAFIAIVGNLPIEPWQNLLAEMGLTQLIQDLINITSGLYAIYIVCTISYETARLENQNPITCVILSLASFLVLVPQVQIPVGEEEYMTVIKTVSIGSEGIFIAIIVGISITMFYSFLVKKKVTIKMPESVPPMVSDSLSPTFAAMIIFMVAFIVKAGFHFSPYGDAMNFVNTVVSAPISAIGTNAVSVIIVFTFANVLWFFGIHPSAIINIFYAVITPLIIENITAFLQGQPLPYFEIMFMLSVIMIGGTGNTLGLSINMLFSKSERYKSLSKLSFVPSIFNINEPLIFGVPVILNPIFFLPLVFSTAVGGVVVHLLYKIGFLNYMNPTIELPWVTPPVIAEWFYGGWQFALAIIIVIAVQTLLFMPFFKMADKKAVDEEKMVEKGLN
ncbi:PTS sugar transporter subunit IIC [[Clostridium] dakarense]|uniref:PTS sugar transporter subunit IIC n=1 Tax=Faecalimicrobium dakarense TaxID=1301100 RepID=UPI0004B262AC|nr:PTS transporter subunit EIIC [[Clostridium] dakarense]